MTPLLSLQAVCARLAVSYKTVRRHIAKGDLKAALIGRQWRIAEKHLDAFLERQRQRAVVVEQPIASSQPSRRGASSGQRSSLPGSQRYM